jgi:hypothetical protein
MSLVLQQAFDQACCEGDLAVAEGLLPSLESVLSRMAERKEDGDRSASLLLAAYRHIWSLRHGLMIEAETVSAPRGRPPKARGSRDRELLKTSAWSSP